MGLQRQDGEKLTDFAGRLENTIREAAVHINNKYKKDKVDLTRYGFLNHGRNADERESQRLEPEHNHHQVKTIDSHYTAIGIACEAQQYVDRGLKMDTPILIGQNILVNNTLDSFIIDNQNATVEFRLTHTSGYTAHTAPIIPASTSPYGPAYGALTIHNNNQPTIGHQIKNLKLV